jgi:hypothetical protein
MDVSKSKNAVKIRDGSSSRGISIIMDGIISRTARIDSRKTTIFSRDTSNSSRNSKLENLETVAETMRTSQMSTAEGIPATARKPEIVETSQQQ